MVEALVALREGRPLVLSAGPNPFLAEALEPITVPGRFQCVRCAAGPLLLDVAHNPDALGCFARTFASAYPGRPKRLFVAMLRDKDLAGSLAVLRRTERLEVPLLVGCAASAPESRRYRLEDFGDALADLKRGELARGVFSFV